MSDIPQCPCCGSPVHVPPQRIAERTGADGGPLAALYREVARIRQLAETQAAEESSRRIAELTREVNELRATVARLRGSAMPGLARAR